MMSVTLDFLLYRFDALWMPLALSQKGGRFQSYRSGYHEVAPSLDSLFKKAHFVIRD